MRQLFGDRLDAYAVPDAPKIVSMAMTSRCNLRCVMCDHGIRKVAKEDFDPALIVKIGDFIGQADIVDLTGLGEPLLSDLFWKIIDSFPRSDSLPPLLMFNTNGLLLTEVAAARIMRARMRRIRVSIDSPDAEMFRQIRGATLADVVAGARRLIAARGENVSPLVGIEMTVMRRNIAQMEQMIDLAASLGVDFVEFWPMNEIGAGAAARWKIGGAVPFDYAEELLSGVDRVALEAAIDAAFMYAEGRSVGAAFIIGNGRATSAYPREQCAAMPIEWRPKSIKCDLPWKELRASYDGGVTACCWGPRPIGNLRDSTMQEIWNGRNMRRMRRDLMAGKPPKFCRGAACGFMKGH